MPTKSNGGGEWSTGDPHTGNTGLDRAVVATGFEWKTGKIPLPSGIVTHLQHRHIDATDQRTVKRYEQMAKAGNNCPPIGITVDGVVVWGNHRIAGYLAAGRTEIDAIIFNVTALDDEEEVA